MTTYISDEVRAGLDAARKAALKSSSRLRVQAGEDLYRVTGLWAGGFSVLLEDAPKLRGLVDLYDGSRHLSQCLIVASEEAGDEMRYEFKRSTAASDSAPLDFYRDPQSPVGYLGVE